MTGHDNPFDSLAALAEFAERRFRQAGGPAGRRGGPHGGPHGGSHGGPRGHRGGPGGKGGHWQQAELPDVTDAADWFAGRLPDDWFTGRPEVSADREEILVVGELAAPGEGGTAAAQGRIQRFREDTRERRMQIADEAEARYGRKVAWGARIADERVLFSTLSVPVMTRLRHDERRVLDTLVESGVARSRSDAVVWCVKLVSQHADEWLGELRRAMSEVETLRTQGPDL